MTFLGIDLGTGSVKAAVVEAAGSILAESAHGYPVVAPQPGWAESDPATWLAAVRAAAGAVLGAQQPEAVGFSGQMHGIVVTDADLQPLRPAILWADARSTKQAHRMAQRFTATELARLGSPAVPGFAATSVAWLYANEPEVMARAHYVLQPKDWLRAALGGAIATDPSDATGTLLCDVVTGSWSPAAADWAGLPEHLLPQIISSTAPAGVINLGREIPAVVGAADTACALAGLGLQPGDGFIAVGTGSQVVSVLTAPVLDETLVTHTFATAGGIGAGWFRVGAVQNAGLSLTAALRWFGADVAEAVAALGEGVKASDPIYVPYLAGERTPFMDADLRGSWHGIGLSTDRAAMLRSIMEGVAQAVALATTAVSASGTPLPEVVPLVGGGTHDLAFQQLLADATGCALGVVEVPNAAVVGAALLAAGRVRAEVRAQPASVVEPNETAMGLLAKRRGTMAWLVQSQQVAK
ncbi:sugar kinase [Actinomycetes bacterium]|nr:sugar kinase [Actinomycetes bacterium]